MIHRPAGVPAGASPVQSCLSPCAPRVRGTLAVIDPGRRGRYFFAASSCTTASDFSTCSAGLILSSFDESVAAIV